MAKSAWMQYMKVLEKQNELVYLLGKLRKDVESGEITFDGIMGKGCAEQVKRFSALEEVGIKVARKLKLPLNEKDALVWEQKLKDEADMEAYKTKLRAIGWKG